MSVRVSRARTLVANGRRPAVVARVAGISRQDLTNGSYQEMRDSLLAAMRERGFSLGRPFPPYDTWCRVSMGRVEQMQAFAGAIREVFA